MTPQIVTAPVRYPVTIGDVRAQLRLDAGDDDTAIAGYIAAATANVERMTGLALITRTYKVFLDAWPTDPKTGGTAGYVKLLWAPLVSVTHVKTYDDDDVATTMSSGDYYVDATSYEGRIVLRSDASWPDVDRVANGIEIQWVAGFGSNAGDVPEPIRFAILLLISHWHANREPVNVGNIVNTLPFGIEDLLANYRIISF